MFSANSTPQEIQSAYNKRRSTLRENGCLTLGECANMFGLNEHDYLEMAAKGKAVLFTMENGENYVPVWGLQFDKNETLLGVNQMAVHVAKLFKRHEPLGDPARFCTFLKNKQVGMSTDYLYSEVNEGQHLSSEFLPRVYERFLAEPEAKTLFRPLRYATTMAHGPNEEYVKLCLDIIIPHLLGPNHTKPDDIEHVIGKMIPKPGIAPMLKVG